MSLKSTLRYNKNRLDEQHFVRRASLRTNDMRIVNDETILCTFSSCKVASVAL